MERITNAKNNINNIGVEESLMSIIPTFIPMRALFLLILFGAYFDTFSCQCIRDSGPLTQKSLDRYKFIAYGLMYQENEQDYSIKIIEQFKGELPDTIYHVKDWTSCGEYIFHPDGGFEPQKWLLYLDDTLNDSRVEINQCSRSHFFFFPKNKDQISKFHLYFGNPITELLALRLFKEKTNMQMELDSVKNAVERKTQRDYLLVVMFLVLGVGMAILMVMLTRRYK